MFVAWTGAWELSSRAAGAGTLVPGQALNVHDRAYENRTAI